MAVTEEEKIAAFLKQRKSSSISTSKDIDEKLDSDSGVSDEASKVADFLANRKKVTEEQPKKEAVTPIAEKVTEEPAVVAQNQAPIEGESQEAQSFLSALPSQESGLDSQSSVDSELETPFEAPVGIPSPFRNVKEERLDMEKQLAEAKAKQAEDPLAVKEGTDAYSQLEAALAPKMTTEKGIESVLYEIESDPNIPRQDVEAARIMAVAKKDELLERFEAGKQEEQEKMFKGEIENARRQAGDDVTQYINREKDETVSSGYVSKEVVEEYKLNKKINDLTSKDAINTALISATIPHNAYVKLAAINKSENKVEELAAYKSELLEQIKRDNDLLGNNISEEEFKSISERGVEYVSAVASSLSEISDKVNTVQGEKNEFLNKKHKSIDEEISSLRRKLIEKASSEEGLDDEDKVYMEGLIKKQESLKESFFEKDGAKTANLLIDDVKEGSNSYNLYKEILKGIPKDLPSKEKFDLFYIAMKRISQRSLKEANMVDENGNYDAKIENALRDFVGVENVLGVELPQAVGGLSTMEKEALEMKGKVDDLANIFLNNTAHSSENYWDELYGSLMGGLFPETAKASGLLSDTAEAGETVATLGDYGITEGEGVNKEALEAFSDLVATPKKRLNAQKVGSTLGGSFAMMAKLMIGTGAIKMAKAGKLGKVLDKAEKFLDSSKLGKLIASSLKQGANAEFSGQLFDDKEELEFKQFFAGQMASDVIEGLLKGPAGKLASSLIKNAGVNKKAAFDFAGKVFSRAAGEFTEESMQTIVGAFNASDSLKGTVAELRKQFPDMSSVTEFAVLTGLMGATFGLQTSYGDVRKRLKDGGYDTDAADAIMEEIGSETKKAAEIINEGKEGGETEEGSLTRVTDKKSPVKGGDTFTVVRGVGEEVVEESYQINKIDKDFNVHVTINGKESVLTKEEFSKLRKNQSFELFREFKAPTEETTTETQEEVTEAAPVAEETVTEPTTEVVVTPAEVTIDDSGESKYTNKEGLFFADTEVAKMTPEELSNMVIKNPNAEVQANLDKAAGVTEGVESEVVSETEESKAREVELKRLDSLTDEEYFSEQIDDKISVRGGPVKSVTFSDGTTVKDKILESGIGIDEAGKVMDIIRNAVTKEEIDREKATLEKDAESTIDDQPLSDLSTDEMVDFMEDASNSAEIDISNKVMTKRSVDQMTEAFEKAKKDNYFKDSKSEDIVESIISGVADGSVVVSGVKPKIETKSKTAGETKEEVKTEQETKVEAKKLKAEAKQAKADAKLEVAKESESRNNTLVDTVKKYNKKDGTQKKGKAGKVLLDKARKMAEDQGHTFEIKEDGSVSVTDSKGKEVKTSNEFKKKKNIPETSSEDQAWTVNKIKKGDLGDGTGVRMSYFSDIDGDVTLESGDVKEGFKQIEKGNLSSVSAQKVLAAMAEARKKGFFEVSQGTGGTTDYENVLIEDSTDGSFSEEELVSKEVLDAESAAKAEEQTKAQNILDARDSFVEAVRKMKYKPPGGLMSSVGILELYNGIVEGMAKTIYAGGSTAAAVAEAMDKIVNSDWYKKMLPAERKKAKAKLQADFIEKSEKINELAKIEKAKVEGTKKEANKAKSKEKKDKKSAEAKDLISRIEAAAKPLKEGEKNDPSVGKKVRKYVLSMLTNPNVSEEVKDRIRRDPDSMYDQQSNAWSLTQAMEVVDAFANEEGGLEFLLEDVKGNFLEYGAVGAVILDGIATLYARDGRFNDSQEVQMALAKIGTVMGQAIQQFSKLGSDDIIKAYFKTSMGAGLRAKKEVKDYRDKKLDKLSETSDPESKKTNKDVILDTKEQISGTVDEFIEKIARGDEDALAFIDKALKKSEKADAGKKKTPKKISESRKKALAKEKTYRKKRIAEAKKNKGKYLNSSFGLTKEGVEMVIDVTASYVRSGVVNTKILADKIRSMMKEDFDHDISDADLETVLKNEKVRKVVKEASLDKSSETLARKVLKHTEAKENEKTADAVDTLIKNLFAKAKETLPVRAKKESDESYRKKLLEAMEAQDFAREVWDKSKNTISDILDNKQAKGEITSAEKAQVLKELEEFFGDKVGAPFSKSLVGKAIKEQLKSDNETIRDIVAEHYSRVEKNGKTLDSSQAKVRELAEKIVASTNMSPEKAMELQEIIEKEFTEALRADAEKVLAKVLGVENLSQEKLDQVVKKNKVTVDAILKAINAGALTNDSYIDAFGEVFGFATISNSDISKINALVYDLTLLPVKSVARDMALIDFRTFLGVLDLENQSRTKRYMKGVAFALFYQHILGNTPTVLRSAYGIINSSIVEKFISILKNPVLFAHDLAKAFANPATTAKGYFNNLAVSRMILKDAWKRGYIPYESGMEGVEDSSTKLGYLDRLANADLKDLSKGEKILRAYEWVSNKQLRVLMATDAIGHYNARERHIRTREYNKMLAEGRSRLEKSFWSDLDTRTGKTKELKAEALLQAENEKAKLESEGVDVSNFRVDQRARDIIFNNLEQDTQEFSDRMATQMRMGHHPKGWFGVVYNIASKLSDIFPPSVVILPFLRIPLNMADAALDYVPLVGLYRGVFGRGSGFRNRTGENTMYTDKFLDKTRAKKEHISEDRADYLIKAAIGTAAIGAAITTVVSQATKDDDDPDKKFQVVYKGTGSYADNKRSGIRQFHYRAKVNGKWGPWIDYRDTTMYMILAFAGGISDKLVYDREDPDAIINSEEISDAIWTGAGSAIMSAKEQNFLQSASDIMDTFRTEDGVIKGAGTFVLGSVVRAAKGVTIPSALTTSYNYYKTLTGQKMKEDTRIEDNAGQFMLDKFAKDIPFVEDYKDDATDGLGTPIDMENKVPFISDDLIKKDKYNPITELTKGTQLQETDVAPILGAKKEFVYRDGYQKGKEVPLEIKKKMIAEYKKKLLEAYDNQVLDKLEDLKEQRGAGGKRMYKAGLKKIQKRVYEKLMSDWDYVSIE